MLQELDVIKLPPGWSIMKFWIRQSLGGISKIILSFNYKYVYLLIIIGILKSYIKILVPMQRLFICHITTSRINFSTNFTQSHIFCMHMVACLIFSNISFVHQKQQDSQNARQTYVQLVNVYLKLPDLEQDTCYCQNAVYVQKEIIFSMTHVHKYKIQKNFRNDINHLMDIFSKY